MGTRERGTGGRSRWVWGALATCLLTGGVAAGTVQTPPQSLSQLTVPASALPAGCALEPIAASSVSAGQAGAPRIRSFHGEPFPDNPWSGTEPQFVARVRTVIDPSPRAGADGPPLDPGAAAAFEATRAVGVVEAYRARYISESGAAIEVLALTFEDAALVPPEPVSALTGASRGFSRRFVREASVVRVVAPGEDACARAVETHVRTLVARP